MYVDYVTPSDTVIDTKAINNALTNILMTRRGSMPGKPFFGSDLYKVIFSQLDHITINIIKTMITDSLSEYEPRIEILNIDIKDIPEFNKVVTSIYYRYMDNGLELTDTIKLNLSQ